jgi:hypothetical protein
VWVVPCGSGGRPRGEYRLLAARSLVLIAIVFGLLHLVVFLLDLARIPVHVCHLFFGLTRECVNAGIFRFATLAVSNRPAMSSKEEGDKPSHFAAKDMQVRCKQAQPLLGQSLVPAGVPRFSRGMHGHRKLCQGASAVLFERAHFPARARGGPSAANISLIGIEPAYWVRARCRAC